MSVLRLGGTQLKKLSNKKIHISNLVEMWIFDGVLSVAVLILVGFTIIASVFMIFATWMYRSIGLIGGF